LLCDVTASNLVQVDLYAILPLRYQKEVNADRLRKLARKQMVPAFEVVLFEQDCCVNHTCGDTRKVDSNSDLAWSHRENVLDRITLNPLAMVPKVR